MLSGSRVPFSTAPSLNGTVILRIEGPVVGLANNPLHIAPRIENTRSLSVLASACYEHAESRSVQGSDKGQTLTPDLAA
jgi:hypothetical protein